MFKPLKKASIAYRIIDNFIHLVRSGEIRTGEKLPSERHMAEALQVSRSSVREAMQILAFNKVVDIRPGNGTFLLATPLQLTEQGTKYATQVDDDPLAFVQSLEIRMMVEPLVGRLVATCITDEELAELDAIIVRMEQLADDGALGGYAVEDLNFHYTYPKAARNPALHRMVNEYCITNHHLVLFGKVPGLERESLVQHKAIVEAFRAHDADLAEEVLREHIYYALRKNINFIHSLHSRDRFDIIARRT